MVGRTWKERSPLWTSGFSGLSCLLDTRLLIYWSASFRAVSFLECFDSRHLRQPGMLSRNVNLTSFSGDTVHLRFLLRMRFFSFFLRMNALHPQLTGQPVLIGGTMGTCSYVLTGTEQGMTETFGTTCHGAVSQEVISWRPWDETVSQRTKLLKGQPMCDSSLGHTSRD